MRENVAETADTVDIAPVGIDYGILNAFFCFFLYSSLSKIFCQLSVKNRHAHVQFYLRLFSRYEYDYDYEISWKSESALYKY